MNIKHNAIVIPTERDSDPFVNCKLDRKKYSQILTNIVSTYHNGFVLALNNKWGTGKTTFIRMWKQELDNRCYKTLYFNAWENDFQDEVIIALLSELEEFKSQASKEFNQVLEKAALFLTKLGPILAKGAAKKFFGDEAVAEVIEAATEYTSEEIEKDIEQYNLKKNGIVKFRHSLAKFVEEIDDEKPLIFIIDELDRCRPNYAVRVLERIKHLFSVEGIVFVLSIDKTQLGHAIKGAYGNDNIDANEYLRRFIDLEYSLPESSIDIYVEHMYEYFDFKSFLNSKERLNSSELGQDGDRIKFIAKILFSKANLSLRQIEKIFSRIRIVLRSLANNQYIFPEILVIIGYLDLEFPRILDNIRKHKYDMQQLVDKMDEILYPFLDYNNERLLNSVLASILVRYENSINSPFEDNHQKLIKVNEDKQPVLNINSKFTDEKNTLQSMIDYYTRHFDTRSVKFDYIINKYDLTENFVILNN